MPYPNEHAFRLISPGRFEKDSFRRKNIAAGISIIVGKLSGKDSLTTQAYRFKTSSFTFEQAKKWVTDHNINYILAEKATGVQALAIQCLSIDSFSREKILSLIPEDVLSKIKEKEERPFFQAYSLAHEGTSRPLTIIGDTARPISWPRRAIKSIKNLVLKGVKFFVGHNSDSSTQGRRSVAEVVANTEQEIDGVLHHVVIAHVPEKNVSEVKNYDICSQEAMVNLFEDNGIVIADSVNEITGIALASSKEDKPGFPGALRLGMIQAFENNKSSEDDKGEVENMDLSTVDFNMLLGELKRRNVAPLQVFSVDEIKRDKNFSKVFQDAEDLEKVKGALTEKEKEIETIKGEKEKISLELGKTTAKPRLESLMETKKITGSKKDFILKRAGALEDVTDQGLESFISDKLEDYKASVEVFGVTEQEIDQAGEDTTGGTGPKNIDKNDYSKASNNEFLEEDLAL